MPRNDLEGITALRGLKRIVQPPLIVGTPGIIQELIDAAHDLFRLLRIIDRSAQDRDFLVVAADRGIEGELILAPSAFHGLDFEGPGVIDERQVTKLHALLFAEPRRLRA